MEKIKNKKLYLLLGVILLVILLVGIGFSFAYFTANVDGDASANVITTGVMKLTFEDGALIGTQSNMVPGTSITKKFKVKNTGTVSTNYNVYFSEVINTFVTKTDLVYNITCKSNNCNESNKENITVPSSPDKMIDNQAIEPNETQEYELTILFKETNVNQDDNKGKKFSAKISVNEYKEAPLPLLANVLKETVSADIVHDDQTVDENLRFVGANPNNYVKIDTANGEELWRIIGVMSASNTGYSKDLVKIVRDDSIGSYAYDSTGYYSGTMGSSEWARPSELSQRLNSTEYGFMNKGYLQNINWKSVDVDNPEYTGLETYQKEKVINNNQRRYPTTLNTYVALPYLSDFKLSTSSSGCDGNHSFDRGSDCANNSWLMKYVEKVDNDVWTMTELTTEVYATYVRKENGFSLDRGSLSHDVFPAAYLNENALCANCYTNPNSIGSHDNPYIIRVNEINTQVTEYKYPLEVTYEEIDTKLGRIKNNEIVTEITVKNNSDNKEFFQFSFNDLIKEFDGGTYSISCLTSNCYIGYYSNSIFSYENHSIPSFDVDIPVEIRIEANAEQKYRVTLKFNNVSSTNGDARFKANIKIDTDYDFANNPLFTNYLIELGYNGGIAYDETVDNNIRFVGADPDNYVDLELDNGTTETWRIIGIFNYNTTGNTKPLIKLIRAESIGEMLWSNNNSSDWATSSLMNTLQNDYACYYSEEVNWRIGATLRTTNSPALIYYNNERSNSKTSDLNYHSKWQGNVALPYVSDFMYGKHNNESWINDLTKSNPAWTLSVMRNSNNNVYYYSNGDLVTPTVGYPFAVYPSLYLKSNVRCDNCDEDDAGSSSNPYKLTFEEYDD